MPFVFIKVESCLLKIIRGRANDLKLTEREIRLPHKSNTPGKEAGDHAGHLTGDMFGGSPD